MIVTETSIEAITLKEIGNCAFCHSNFTGNFNAPNLTSVGYGALALSKLAKISSNYNNRRE